MRILLSIGLLAVALGAQQEKEKSRNADVGTNVAQPVVDFHDSISDYFRQSRRAVDAIAQKGIPSEEIPAVLLIARRSSASSNQVIAARQSGKEFAEIAKTNSVNVAGDNFVTEANVIFLSEYHGRPPEEIRALLKKGASVIEVNQQFRRVGMKPATEKPRAQ